jgi:hypothetical protein
MRHEQAAEERKRLMVGAILGALEWQAIAILFFISPGRLGLG